MSFMFKGPASLTTGSVIDAVNVTSDNMTVDVDLTVGDDLTVTDDLTVGDVITSTLKFSSAGIATSLNQGSAGDTGDGRVLASKSYVDDKHKVVNHSTTNGASSFATLNIGNIHVLFLNTTPSSGINNITFAPTWTNVSDGHRIFIAWVARLNNATAAIKINFGANGIQAATNLFQYMDFTGLHSSALIYYSATSGKWYSVESSGATTFS